MPRGNRINVGITAALMRYFSQHPGIPQYLPDIAKDIGYPEDACRHNITNMISAQKLKGVEVVVRGRAWQYHPETVKPVSVAVAPSKRMFQEIGPTKDGAIIIESEDGRLYKAEEI